MNVKQISLFLAALAACLGGCREKAPPPRPSVILITVDTLRADHLGAYGHPAPTSPNFDDFARASLLFLRCYSHAPKTGPSFASLFTGRLPHEAGLVEHGFLAPEASTLAELLGAADYRTWAVVSNYVLRRAEGFAQGSDVYDDEMDDEELNAAPRSDRR